MQMRSEVMKLKKSSLFIAAHSNGKAEVWRKIQVKVKV